MFTDIKKAKDVHVKKINNIAVVGNGPSFNFSLLDNIELLTFGLGAVGTQFDKTVWRPTVYIASSSFIEREKYRDGIERAIDESLVTIACKKLYSAWAHRAYLVPCEQGDIHAIGFENKEEMWSDNPAQWVSKYGTSAYVAIQWAVFLGWTTIYLLFFDGYKKTWKNHPEDYPEAEGFDVDKFQATRYAAFELAKYHTEKRGVEVVTVGNTDLDMFKNISEEEFCGRYTRL